MTTKLVKISKNFYSFSVWDESNLVSVYTGDAKQLKSRAKKVGDDISFKMHILNSDEYELNQI